MTFNITSWATEKSKLVSEDKLKLEDLDKLFESDFRKRFYPPHYKASKNAIFFALKQGNLSVQSYINMFSKELTAMRRCYPGLDETIYIDFFINSLDRDIGGQVRNREPETMELCFKLAIGYVHPDAVYNNNNGSRKADNRPLFDQYRGRSHQQSSQQSSQNQPRYRPPHQNQYRSQQFNQNQHRSQQQDYDRSRSQQTNGQWRNGNSGYPNNNPFRQPPKNNNPAPQTFRRDGDGDYIMSNRLDQEREVGTDWYKSPNEDNFRYEGYQAHPGVDDDYQRHAEKYYDYSSDNTPVEDFSKGKQLNSRRQ